MSTGLLNFCLMLHVNIKNLHRFWIKRKWGLAQELRTLKTAQSTHNPDALTILLLRVFGWVLGWWRWRGVRWCMSATDWVLLLLRGAETGARVTFGLSWGASSGVRGHLSVRVRVVAIFKALSLTSAHGVAWLRARRHGGGAGMRREVLRCGHRHEAHAEMTAERCQVTHLPNRRWGGIFTAVEQLAQSCYCDFIAIGIIMHYYY